VTGSAMCVGVGEAEVMRSEGQGAVAMVAMATPAAVGERSGSVMGAGQSPLCLHRKILVLAEKSG
jgi:hypothetical protein